MIIYTCFYVSDVLTNLSISDHKFCWDGIEKVTNKSPDKLKANNMKTYENFLMDHVKQKLIGISLVTKKLAYCDSTGPEKQAFKWYKYPYNISYADVATLSSKEQLQSCGVIFINLLTNSEK